MELNHLNWRIQSAHAMELLHAALKLYAEVGAVIMGDDLLLTEDQANHLTYLYTLKPITAEEIKAWQVKHGTSSFTAAKEELTRSRRAWPRPDIE